MAGAAHVSRVLKAHGHRRSERVREHPTLAYWNVGFRVYSSPTVHVRHIVTTDLVDRWVLARDHLEVYARTLVAEGFRVRLVEDREQPSPYLEVV